VTVNPDTALRMLRERARQFVSSGMDDCLARANDDLFELTKTAGNPDQQSQYLDAMRLWHGARRGVADAFIGGVDKAFMVLGGRVHERCVAAASQEPGLAIDDELDEIIALNAIATAATEPMREVLAQLLGRVEALCGFTLTPQEFPLTPHFVMNGLAREIGSLGLVPRARLAILRACDATLLRTLPGVVMQADDLLRQLGVAPCRDGPVRIFAASRAAPIDLLSSRDGDAYSGADAVSRIRASRRVPCAGPGGVAIADASPSVALPEAESREIDRVGPSAEFCSLLDGLRGLAPAPGGRRASIRSRLEGALLRMGRSFAELRPEDAHRVQLVDALFDEMVNATWIPAALGELLAAAEIPVIALASADPTFLAKPLHPARRLLEEIIVAATDFLHDDNYRDQELFRRAGSAIDSLMELRGDVDRLAALLVEFVALVEQEWERGDQRAAPVLREAAARVRIDAAHATVARILNSRVTGRRYPLALIDMLERGWCLVLFDAWFKFGEASVQWRVAVHLLDQLVGIAGDAEPDQELVERLWETLAARFDDMAFDQFEARCLLDNLRLCLCDPMPGPAPPSLVLVPAEARELNDPRLLVTVDCLQLALPGTPGCVAHEVSASLNDADLGRADALRPGSWIEFREAARAPCVARLLGVVPPADTHVFGDRNGVALQRLPRLLLALALKEGRVIPLDNAQLFDRALDQALLRVTSPPPANVASA
jgi:hypothetical protein